ncbi:unnamed protein product [Gongylonema pulchrum]|uniref:Uncharacterized protein n=1 Tax=Gongylonema pulchrum TaxID=637853 RepID=A0A3P6R5K6_9BILA|nr:unnamed protein product [Gongylonema pulchrum]
MAVLNSEPNLPLFQSLRIAQLALWNCFIEIIWFYGITFCGPLRSILVFEQSPSVVMVALLTLLKGSSSPAKTRGVIALGLGYLSLILMDSDATVETDHREFCSFLLYFPGSYFCFFNGR